MQLVACSRCRRHIRVSASRCPFCGAAAEARFVARLVDHGGRLSRAAVFAGAAACYTSSPQQVQGPPPPPPPDDQQQQHQPPPPPPPDGGTTSFAQPPPGDAAQPQGPGSIEGRAFNVHGLPLGNYIAVLQGTTLKLRATVDASGKFVFANLPPGTYHVIVEDPNGTKTPGLAGTVAVAAGQTVQMVLQVPQPYVPPREPCCKPYGAPPARRRVV